MDRKVRKSKGTSIEDLLRKEQKQLLFWCISFQACLLNTLHLFPQRGVYLREKFLNRVCGLELFFSVPRSLSGLVWAYLLAVFTTGTFFPTIQHTRCSLFPVHQEPHYLALDSPQIRAWDKNVSAVSLFGRWLQEAGVREQSGPTGTIRRKSQYEDELMTGHFRLGLSTSRTRG